MWLICAHTFLIFFSSLTGRMPSRPFRQLSYCYIGSHRERPHLEATTSIVDHWRFFPCIATMQAHQPLCLPGRRFPCSRRRSYPGACKGLEQLRNVPGWCIVVHLCISWLLGWLREFAGTRPGSFLWQEGSSIDVIAAIICAVMWQVRIERTTLGLWDLRATNCDIATLKLHASLVQFQENDKLGGGGFSFECTTLWTVYIYSVWLYLGSREYRLLDQTLRD